MSNLIDKNQGSVIIILTASWRYFASGALLALLCQFALFLSLFPTRYYLLISLLLFIISQYYIYRLWLDNHFFKLIYQLDTPQLFDSTLFVLFPKKKPAKSMEQRWIGTKRLYSKALISTLVLWVWLIITIISL